MAYARGGRGTLVASRLAVLLGAVCLVAVAVTGQEEKNGPDALLSPGLIDYRLKDASFGQWADAGNDMTMREPTVDDQVSVLQFACGCKDQARQLRPAAVSDLRSTSDAQCAESADVPQSSLTNFWWVWGQFLAHDAVSTLDALDALNPSAGVYTFDLGGDATMRLRRLAIEPDGDRCRAPLSTATAAVDAGAVYSHDAGYLRHTLREPGDTCRLAVGPGDLLPLSEDVDERIGTPVFLAGAAMSRCPPVPHLLAQRSARRAIDALRAPRGR